MEYMIVLCEAKGSSEAVRQFSRSLCAFEKFFLLPPSRVCRRSTMICINNELLNNPEDESQGTTKLNERASVCERKLNHKCIYSTIFAGICI